MEMVSIQEIPECTHDSKGKRSSHTLSEGGTDVFVWILQSIIQVQDSQTIESCCGMGNGTPPLEQGQLSVLNAALNQQQGQKAFIEPEGVSTEVLYNKALTAGFYHRDEQLPETYEAVSANEFIKVSSGHEQPIADGALQQHQILSAVKMPMVVFKRGIPAALDSTNVPDALFQQGEISDGNLQRNAMQKLEMTVAELKSAVVITDKDSGFKGITAAPAVSTAAPAGSGRRRVRTPPD